METKVKILNLPTGYQSVVMQAAHTIIADEPISMGGTDLGLSPVELLLGAIGACKVSTMRYFARKNDWDVGNIEARISHSYVRKNGQSISTLSSYFYIEGGLSEVQKSDLLRYAENCHIVRLIHGKWDFRSSLETRVDNLGEPEKTGAIDHS